MVESNQAGSLFGRDVSGAGDVNGDGYDDVIIGALNYDNGNANEGGVFIYHGSGNGLSSNPAIILESNQASAAFSPVSGAGDVNGDGYDDIIVGGYQYDNGQTDEGAAFVYYGAKGDVEIEPTSFLESNQASAALGLGVSNAGDVNNDGYDDVLIGAPGYDNGETNEGAVFVHLGTKDGLSAAPSAILESNQASADFGSAVASAGDINGDNYDDIVVGARFYDNGQTDEGAMFVYQGSASGISTTPTLVLERDQANAHFGTSVSGAGDVNKDGYDDVIAGALLYDNGQTDEGAAFIYYGGPSGLPTTPNVFLESNQSASGFGLNVAGAGDVNKDGYDEIMVGAYTYDNGETNEGVVLLHYGSASGISTTPSVTLESNQANALFGVNTSSAGDVNKDGYDDIVVGAYTYDNGETDEGVAFVYYGSSTGISSKPSLMLESNQTNAIFGYSVSGAGDMNGDGYDDVAIGAFYYDNGETDEGAVFIYLGSPTGLSPSYFKRYESNQTGLPHYGRVSQAGDINGDGYGDIVVGAYSYDNGQTDEGAAFIYYGEASEKVDTAPTFLAGNQTSAGMGWDVSEAGDVNGDGYGDVLVGAYFYQI